MEQIIIPYINKLLGIGVSRRLAQSEKLKIKRNEKRHCIVCSIPLIISMGSGVKNITSNKINNCHVNAISSFWSRRWITKIKTTAAARFTIKGIKVFTVNSLNKALNNMVYKMEEEAD